MPGEVFSPCCSGVLLPWCSQALCLSFSDQKGFWADTSSGTRRKVYSRVIKV